MKVIVQCLLLGMMATAGGLATRAIHGPIRYAVECDPSRLDPLEICMDSVKQWQGEVLWVDARTRAEWTQGHVKDAVYLNLGDAEGFDNLVAAELERLASAKHVVVYCGGSGCELSKDVARRLKELDFGNEVRALHGGWSVLAADHSIAKVQGASTGTK